MEDDLDRIAERRSRPRRMAERLLLRRRQAPGPAQRHRQPRRDRRARDQLIAIADGITLRIGKYGPYLEVAEPRTPTTPRRVNVPEELAPDELTPAKARELIDAPVVGDRVLGVNPANGKTSSPRTAASART